MAKREPKLGDVQKMEEDDVYHIQVFRLGCWHGFRAVESEVDADIELGRMEDLLPEIIREAREGGVNDAIAAVKKMPEYDISTLKDVLEEAICDIREKTGVKE